MTTRYTILGFASRFLLRHKWAWLLFSVCLFCIAGVILALKWGRAVHSEQAEVLAEKKKYLALNSRKLQFTECDYDAGVLVRGPVRLIATHDYEFINLSGRPVSISKDVPLCSCVGIDYPQGPIPPKGKGKVTIRIDLGDRFGFFNTGAGLFLDNSSTELINLFFSCFVLDPPLVLPDYIDFGNLVAGEKTERDLMVRIPLSPNEKNVSIATSTDVNGIHSHVKESILKKTTIGTNSVFFVREVPIKLSFVCSKPGGDIDGLLKIRVVERNQTIPVRVSASITHPTISVLPAAINFGAIKRERLRRSIRIKCADSALSSMVHSVEADRPSAEMRAWLEPASAGDHEKLLWAEINPAQIKEGLLKGKLILRVKDSKYPTIEIPYLGYHLAAGPKSESDPE